MSPYVNASSQRRAQRQPQSRRSLRLAVVAGAIGAVTAAGTQAAIARPEPEQGATATTSTAGPPPILRSNVKVDALVHERWLYGNRLQEVESGPEKVQAGSDPEHLYGMRYPR